MPSGSIPAQTVAVGETATVNVAAYFTDPDGDALTFAATSSNPQTGTVAVSSSVVTVTATKRGEVTVTVTATDPFGLRSFNRSVRVEARDERITGDSGAVSGREVLCRSRVVRWLAGRLSDARDPGRVRHPLTSLLRTAMLLVAQGRRDH